METKEELQEELGKIIKDIPEEGLIFLIEQANKLVYNKRVEELNAIKINKKRGSFSKTTKNQPVHRCTVTVERGYFNSGFILILGNVRVTLTEDEMEKFVRICHNADNANDASNRLYNRLKQERDDILLTAGINSKNDKCLTAMYEYLKTAFSMKD